ncbi:MAG: carboxymuconolactone decarboxylase family protein [Gammaproteobacteria bacterium]|jgi:AhpD family alkylhydroperoxidase|nr:carboxymuconolactone decarboxylase family protein [Gammaproteobacteria bacterium]HJO10694.1 carboxymuconolactone decarboxylase family protein [Gammaproteobacteria bacterium]|tara:strand:- start:1957 stop:2610 length:654 start_codon:yes stop_codon:yes gene_type:complete
MYTVKLQIRLILFVLLLVLGTGPAYSQGRDSSGPPLDEARIPRVEKPWTEAQREILEPRENNGRVLGVWSTCAQAPELCNAWLVFTDYLLQDSSLPTRDRELLILRIGYLNGGAYEWAAHTGLARRVGITDTELRRILQGPDAPGWSAWDATLLRAADELHANALVSDSTWAALAERYDQRQLMETVFTVGQYNLVAMYLNSTGVQFEEGFEGFPEP